MPSAKTNFGFQRVGWHEKGRRVRAVFDSVAPRYDLMNDLMSFGIHRLWKRFAVALCRVRNGARVLDLAAGTGDLAVLIAPRVGQSGQVVLADVNASMLRVARRRLVDEGIVRSVAYVQADAEHLPFSGDYFDCVCIAFGLRNVTRKEQALASMFRVLRPGGEAVILEFSRPTLSLLQPLYDLYSLSFLPLLGQVVANDETSYRYLAESIRVHPDQDTLKGMMQAAGFERCSYLNLSAGIVALHIGYKL